MNKTRMWGRSRLTRGQLTAIHPRKDDVRQEHVDRGVDTAEERQGRFRGVRFDDLISRTAGA
jgi:hypothetical protein